MMAVTLSDGSLHILLLTPNFLTLASPNDDSAPIHTHALGPQTMQAWCCTWALWQNSTSILTGGDDAKIRHVHLLYPLLNQDGAQLQRMVDVPAYRIDGAYATVWKPHEYGVTAILPLPSPEGMEDQPPLLLTGSYDDCVKLQGRPKLPNSRSGGTEVLAEMDLGGGVWKLTLVSHDFSDGYKYLILASCVSEMAIWESYGCD